MVDDFYRDYILDHYRHPRNFGALESRGRLPRKISIRSCGDQIRMELQREATAYGART